MIPAITGYTNSVYGYKNIPTKKNRTVSFTGENHLIPPTNPNLQASLGGENIRLLDKIRKIGETHNVATYLFGGGVRDTLMNKKTNDLDILVNGDALEFSKQLEEEMGDDIEKITYKPERKRTAIKTKSGIKIDVVPIAKDGSFAQGRKDLKAALAENVQRRDFSINTMLIKIGSKKDGRLNLKFIDIRKARPDLRNNVLKIVDKDFFLNNPVQVARGVRFKTKYGMEVEEQTQQLMEESINHPRKGHVHRYKYKLAREFFRTIKSSNPVTAVTEIVKSKCYKLLFK